MSGTNYIRTISATISTADTDTLLYTVPSGNTFIAFEKKIETEGGDAFEWGVTPSIVAEGFPSHMGLDGTWQWDSGSNAYTMYSSAQGMTMYLNKRVIGTTPRYSIDYEAKTQGSYWLRNDDSEDVLTSTWYTQTEDLVSGGFSMPSSGGSNESVEVVFKEEIVSGSKQVCAIVDDEEQVKERYEAGTSIYVNATASCTASITGILFDDGMIPIEYSNSTEFVWGTTSTIVGSGFPSDTGFDGTWTWSSADNAYKKYSSALGMDMYVNKRTSGAQTYSIDFLAQTSGTYYYGTESNDLFNASWHDQTEISKPGGFSAGN